MSVTPNTDNTEAAVAERRVRWTVDWIKLAPWLYTIGLFAIWEAAVWIFGIRQTILPRAIRRSPGPCIRTGRPSSVTRSQTLFHHHAPVSGWRSSAGWALGPFDRAGRGSILCRPLPDHGRLQRHFRR